MQVEIENQQKGAEEISQSALTGGAGAPAGGAQGGAAADPLAL